MDSQTNNMDSVNAGSNYNNDGAVNANTNTDNRNMGDNQQDNLRRDTSQTSDNDTGSRDAEAQNTTGQDTERRDTDTNNSGSNQSQGDQSNEHRPKKGVAGVIQSNFGADKTTTSTFEKSQGEKYGENFDETGEKIKGRFSVHEGPSGSAAGGGQYSMGGKQGDKAGQDTNMPKGQGSHNGNGSHKEGFGHKLMEKAEGIMHRHHDKNESRTEGQ